jgi:serine/threonine-protein kinase
VHRDLKPANLFLTTRADGTPSVKVLDFGISKASTPDGQDMGMTKTQAVMGSPRYMSPEQMRSTRNVDGRTDIWALGVILYELLSGGPPFNGETMTELCAQILQDMPQPLARRRTDVPAGLDAAIQRCLSKSPDDRPANIAQFAMALADFGGPGSRTSAERIVRVMQQRGVAVGTVPARAPTTGTAPFAQQPPQMPPPGYGSNPGIGSNPGVVGTGPGVHGAGALASSAPRVATGTNAVWGSTTGSPKKSGNGALIAILAGVAAVMILGVVAVVGLYAIRGKAAASAASSAQTSVTPATATAPPAQTASAPSAPAAPSSAATPSAAASSATATTSAAPPAAPPPHVPVANNNPPPAQPPPQQPPPASGMFDGRK